MPFAGYTDHDACVAANSDKRDPDAYCGAIRHRVEKALKSGDISDELAALVTAADETDVQDEATQHWEEKLVHIDESPATEEQLNDLSEQTKDVSRHKTDSYVCWTAASEDTTIYKAVEADDGSVTPGGNAAKDGVQEKQSVPDNAINVDDESEIPEDAEKIEGPRGGLYYVPDEDSTETVEPEPENFSEDDLGASISLLSGNTDKQIEGELVGVDVWPGYTALKINPQDEDRTYTVDLRDVEGDVTLGQGEPENVDPAEDIDIPESDVNIDDKEQEDVSASDDVSDIQSQVNDAESVDEIESLVSESTGIGFSASGTDTEGAKIAASGLLDVSEKFELDNVDSIDISRGSWQDDDELGYASPDGTVHLDPDALDSGEITAAYNSGHFATDDPSHVVLHELGHMVHRDMLDKKDYRELKHTNDEMTKIQREGVKSSMGTYASQHPLEVVAEGFAMQMTGNEIGGYEQKLYNEYGGPDV